MNKILKYLKILVAAILVGTIMFFGVRYYIEQKGIKENEDALVMDRIIQNAKGENENVTFEEVKDEGKINELDEYVDDMYVDFQGEKPLPQFVNLNHIGTEYITRLAYDNLDKIEKEDTGDIIYYTYPELNRLVVSLLGKNAHNRIPDKSTDYFTKTTDGFSKIGMCGSETIFYDYIIDKVYRGSDGLYYFYMHEYKCESERPSIDLEVSGDRAKVSVKNIRDEIIYEYYNEAVAYEENSISIIMVDKDGKEIEFEDVEKEIEKNKDKLVKRELVIEYDEELNLYYLRSSSLME